MKKYQNNLSGINSKCIDNTTKSLSNKKNQCNQVFEIKSQRGLKMGSRKLP